MTAYQLEIWNESRLVSNEQGLEDTENNYSCPFCFKFSLPYPRATIVHGCQSWYNYDCYNCVRLEELREVMSEGFRD